MKIYLNMSGPLSPLYRRFNLEGDTVTVHKEEADLCLDDPFTLPQISDDMSQQSVETKQVMSFFISRYFNRTEWDTQTLVGVPVCGLMNNDLGPQVVTGCGLRYLKQVNDRVLGHFDGYTLALQELGFSGFVSLLFDQLGNIISAQTSIPFYGLFGVLEGVRGKLGEWFEQPNRLYESWVVSLLVTQNPFPNTKVEPSCSKFEISKEIEKHFWSFPRSQQSQGLLGIATAWAGIEDDSINGASGSLERANNFALRTAGSIEVAEKQYRTDLAIRVREKWIDLKNRGLV